MSRFLKACFREPVDTTPIWIMRQAGRYLPQYREVRAKYDFLTMCKTPEVAAEVTVQPIDYLGTDAAILFSDILILPEAMGLELRFRKDHGPEFPQPVRETRDFDRLHLPDPAKETAFVVEAIRLIKDRLKERVPLIGFAGAPFTVASYMVEGGGSENYSLIKGLALREPESFDRLLKMVSDATVAYLNAQISAGADAVQLFDTWAGQLPEHVYVQQVLPHVRNVINALDRRPQGRRVPVIYFAKGAGAWTDHLRTVGADVLGFDWTVDIARARKQVGDVAALQGNLDPTTLLMTPEVIRREAKRVIDAYGKGPGHIFNLGHGITPQVPPENAKALVEAVHEFGAQGA
jgi:uroporphyrinogen decarboxylase